MAQVRGIEVELPVVVHSGERDVDTQAVLVYRQDRPLEVALYTDARMTDVESGVVDPWVFARELLVYSVVGPVGLGDVQAVTRDGRCDVRLSSPDGTCVITFDWTAVLRFLAVTTDLVPLGSEHVDVPDDASTLS